MFACMSTVPVVIPALRSVVRRGTPAPRSPSVESPGHDATTGEPLDPLFGPSRTQAADFPESPIPSEGMHLIFYLSL